MNDHATEFVSLWTQCQPEVRRYIFMLVPKASDAEDVLQQTATSLWQKYDQYDPERPFVAWAIKFAYIEVLSWRQKQSRDRLVFSDELLALLEKTISRESPILEVRRRALDGCLNKLGDHERTLLMKRYSQHGSIKNEAGQSKTSVHKLYYAIEKLRARLLDCIQLSINQEGLQHGG